MKFLLVLSLIIIGTLLNTPTKAQNYPWCAQYGPPAGGMNCGFTTFQQCLTTVSGIGGFCERNTLYVPPPGPHPLNRVQRRRSY
jgi:hypothetical protein